MRSLTLAACAGATIVAVPLVGLPASANSVGIPDGTVRVTLPACGQSSPIDTTLVPDCSYVAIPTKSGDVYYAYLTSPGEATWTGTVRQRTMTFPASGQSWPRLSFLDGVATNTVRASDITGTIDSSGAVELTVNYDTTITALGFSCSAKGQVTLYSSATDPVGGGQGRAVDPVTGAFAVAATPATVPVLTGAACTQAAENLDLARGVGWYLSGYLQLDDAAIPTGSPVPQTARVTLPKKIASKGRTVLVRRTVVTNAGQKAKAKVTWGPKRSAKGKKRKYARLTSTKSGKISLRTTGKAKRLYVKLRLSAPSTVGYEAFGRSKVWKVR